MNVQDLEIELNESSKLNRDLNLEIKEVDLGKLCHDIRNPLSSMKMHTELLTLSEGDNTVSREVRDYLDIINKEIEKILKILSKVEKTKI